MAICLGIYPIFRHTQIWNIDGVFVFSWVYLQIIQVMNDHDLELETYGDLGIPRTKKEKNMYSHSTHPYMDISIYI